MWPLTRTTAATTCISLPYPYERIYHYHIRKTGGTSLNAAFWALANLNLKGFGTKQSRLSSGVRFVRNDLVALKAGAYFFGNSHHPVYNVCLPPGTYTISILRDPVKRVISHYKYLLWVRDDVRSELEEPFRKALMAETCWLGRDFDDFLNNMPRKHLLRQLYMFSADYSVADAVAAASTVTRLCFTESLDVNINDIGRALRLPLTQKRERVFGADPYIEQSQLRRLKEMIESEERFVQEMRKTLVAAEGG